MAERYEVATGQQSTTPCFENEKLQALHYQNTQAQTASMDCPFLLSMDWEVSVKGPPWGWSLQLWPCLASTSAVKHQGITFEHGVQGMANMVLKTVIATLCTRFTLRLADEMGGPEGVAASEVMALTLHTHHGILMHCTERAPAASQAAT